MVKHINGVELHEARVTLKHLWNKSRAGQSLIGQFNHGILYNPAGWDSSPDPEVVADIASRGRRESAIRVHNARLAHFWRWYAARGLDPYSAPVYQIAKFLSDLGKMCNPVMGYCTSIICSP